MKINNIVTNESIELSKSGGNYILDSVDWDSPIVTTNTYRVPYQIGESQSGVIVGTRSPVITGYVIADIKEHEYIGMSWDEYYETQERMIEEQKLYLDKFFSIYQDLRIEVNGYYLDARPTKPIAYSSLEIENNEVLCLFVVQLECYNPLFYKDKKNVSLAMTKAMFHFPLVIPKNKKLIFGEVMRRKSVNIKNDSDIDEGCIIRINATGGTVENPKIYNVNTGEYIGFENVTLNDGDYLTVTTKVGEENAIKHELATGKDESIIGKLIDGSKFLQIQKGESFYAYEVLEQYKNNIEINLEFTEHFFNFRGM